MDPPPILTREQSRRVDEIAVNQYGMSSLVLMENAGRGVVDVLLALNPELRASASTGKSVAILCGKGNNAGDGLVIARHLEIRGVAVKVFLLYPPTEFTGDALKNYKILTRTAVPIVDLAAGSTTDLLDLDAAWLVDAMLGTGALGEPRAPIDAAIDWMNGQKSRRLAVDLPSGLDCDTGVPAAATVHADVTYTFVAGFSKSRQSRTSETCTSFPSAFRRDWCKRRRELRVAGIEPITLCGNHR